MSDTDRKKALVIGLDGAVWTILDPLLKEGWMPNLKGLIDSGASGVLRTTVPPITVPAWSSFMTGKNPGKHGIFEFLLKKPGSYEEVPINSRSRKGKTLWRLLSEAGKKVVVLNVPTTYPPEPVNGAMISGFLTPSGKRDFTHPPELLEELERELGPYYIYMKTKITGMGLTDAKIESLVRDCRDMLDYKFRVAGRLVEKIDPDLLMIHVWGTDRLQHELWDLLDPTHPRHDPGQAAKHRKAIFGYYREVDRKIGELLEAMGAGTNLVILSDHGFGPIHKVLDLNYWLLKEGYIQIKKKLSSRIRLALWNAGLNWGTLFRIGMKILARMKPRQEKKSPVEELTFFRMGKRQPLLSMDDVDWPRTRAYAKTGMGQIVINVRGREPQGCVEPGEEYLSVREEIVSKLRDLVDPETGKRVDGEIHVREEVYNGPFLEVAPDITFLPQNNRYFATNMTGFMSNKVFLTISSFYGNHTMGGVFVGSGPLFRKGRKIEGAGIVDVAPTVLHILGVPVLDSMDGAVLESALEEGFMRAHPVRLQKDTDEQSTDQFEMSDSDREDVIKKLKGLGYIG